MTDGGDESGGEASRRPEPPGTAASEEGDDEGESGADPPDEPGRSAGTAATDSSEEAGEEAARSTEGAPAGSGSVGDGSSDDGTADDGPADDETANDGSADDGPAHDSSAAVESRDAEPGSADPAANPGGETEQGGDGPESGGDVPGPSDLGEGGMAEGTSAVPDPEDVPPDVRKYDRFKKIDGGTYDRANEFLRDRTYITAREWAIARLCADFRTETGVEMTKIGEHLPQLVPFMTDTYSPQAVNQARHAFEEKVRKAGATFLYGAMCDFFTAEELDDVMYEATEVAKFLLEVEGVDLAVEEELAAEDRISSVMREVRESSAALRHDEVSCPECGHSFEASEGEHGVEPAEGSD